MPRFVRNVCATVQTGCGQAVRVMPRTKDTGLSAEFKFRERGAISETTLHVDAEIVDGCIRVQVREAQDGVYRSVVYERKFER